MTEPEKKKPVKKKIELDLNRRGMPKQDDYRVIGDMAALRSLREVAEALQAGADIILLDNMTLDRLREAVQLIAGRARAEASGGINLETIREIAETGVDLISVGALTHSVKAVDISMLFAT